ncbi:MAG: Rieske 2Fe-2S domain-containing protein [Thermoguttaceae bacterium]|jgi:Rieske Fe-S protein
MTCRYNQTPDSRRGFLAQAAAWILGLVAYGVPVLAGLAAFLNPWRQRKEAAGSVRVTMLAALTVGGPPQRFPIISEHSDAWTRYPAEAVGAVFLRRTADKDLAVLSATCPHAGCGVSYDAKANGFLCPCHSAHFDIDGKRTDAQAVSPRDMDSLEFEIRNGAEVWVRFEKFQTGTPQRIAKA